jgi:two-component system, NtrC family, response regulator AtoC
MKNLRIFLVEDDPVYSRILLHHLKSNPEYEVHLYSSGREVLNNLYRNPSVILLDYTLPDMTGLTVIRNIKKFNPDLPVVIISGQEDISVAVELLKEGADDYLVKNDETRSRLWNLLISIRENLMLKEELNHLREEVGRKYEFNKVIIGNCSRIKELFGLMEKAAQSVITVYITGELGTGKELVAKAIHYNSSRYKKRFVTLNVSAIDNESMEAELFGYEKGAFPGALSRKTGLIEEAHRGTLFIDEVSELEPKIQAALIKVLQDKEVSRLGGHTPAKADVRLIVATRVNLAEEVKKGRFREDLYFRLLGLPIDIPPLRERDRDILLLARYFLREFCRENRLEDKKISPEAADKLMQYAYPGNVSELRSVIELAAVLSSSDMIRTDDIRFNATNPLQSFYFQELSLKEYTRRIIRHYLEKYDNNVVYVANKLDVGKSTIYRMLQMNEL